MESKTFSRLLTTSLAFVVVTTIASQAWAQSGSRGSSQSPQSNQTQQRQRTATEASSPQQIQQVARNSQTQVGLDGYCPVCLINAQKWVNGNADHAAVFDGKTYFFPGDDTLQEFVNNPTQYVPALSGDCIVSYSQTGKRVPGDVRFAALHNNRMYLFPSEKERKVFRQSPQAFENTDLAIDGNCIICQVKANKAVPGSAQFTAVFDGFRYQFPSDRERQAFVQSPEQLVAAVTQSMIHNGGVQETSMVKLGTIDNRTAVNQVQFRGQTACAVCEFGVAPLGAPEELGMAVKAEDGKVYIIEEGHTRWPQVYKGRFDGQRVAVSGTIVKSSGNVAWVKPSQLTLY